MPRVPNYPQGVAPAINSWMTLAELVQWVAHGYGPKPKYGDHALAVFKDTDPDGSISGYDDRITHKIWVDHGDLSDWMRADDSGGDLAYTGHLKNLQEAATKVQAALERGDIKAWGQRGYGKPEEIEPVWWSHGPAVSWISFPDPDTYDRVTVRRSDVVRLWPAEGDLLPHPLQWIAAHPEFTNGTKARNAFMAEFPNCGLSAQFEAVWRQVHPEAQRGRPKKVTE